MLVRLVGALLVVLAFSVSAEAACSIPRPIDQPRTSRPNLGVYTDDYTIITGGCIDGTPVGANTPSTGNFTTLGVTDPATTRTQLGVPPLDLSTVTRPDGRNNIGAAAGGGVNIVTDYGAKCDGNGAGSGTDDTTAIQNALNALGTTTGGRVVMPDGKWCHTTGTLTIGNGSASVASTWKPVYLVGGVGNSEGVANGFSKASGGIDYTGTNGAAVKIAGPLRGWGLPYVTINCENGAGTIGLNNVSGQLGDSPNLSISNCITLVQQTTVGALPSGLNNADALHNSYKNLFLYQNAAAAGGVSTYAIVETSPNSTANTDYSDFENVWITYIGGTGTHYGLYLAATDTGRYSHFHFSGAAGGTYHAVAFDYSINANWPWAAALDHFDVPPSLGDFVNIGSPGTSAVNYLTNLGTANGATYPILTGLLPDKLATTWTPVLVGSSTAGTWTYSNQAGIIENSGWDVFARFRIITTAQTVVPSGTARITGLPINATGTTDDFGGCFIAAYSGITLDTGKTQLALRDFATTGVLGLFEMGSNTTYAALPVANVGAAMELDGVCHYRRAQ